MRSMGGLRFDGPPWSLEGKKLVSRSDLSKYHQVPTKYSLPVNTTGNI